MENQKSPQGYDYLVARFMIKNPTLYDEMISKLDHIFEDHNHRFIFVKNDHRLYAMNLICEMIEKECIKNLYMYLQDGASYWFDTPKKYTEWAHSNVRFELQCGTSISLLTSHTRIYGDKSSLITHKTNPLLDKISKEGPFLNDDDTILKVVLWSDMKALGIQRRNDLDPNRCLKCSEMASASVEPCGCVVFCQKCADWYKTTHVCNSCPNSECLEPITEMTIWEKGVDTVEDVGMQLLEDDLIDDLDIEYDQ